MLVDTAPRWFAPPHMKDTKRGNTDPIALFTIPELSGDDSTAEEKASAAVSRILDFQTLLRQDGEETIEDNEALIITNASPETEDAEKTRRWLEYCETIIPGLDFGFCYLTENGADPRDELMGWTYVDPNKLPPSAVERLLALASPLDDPYDPPVVATYRGFITGRVNEQGKMTAGGGELCGFFVKDPGSLGIELSTSVAGAVSVAAQLAAEWSMLQAKNSLDGSLLFDLFGDLRGQSSPAAAMPMEKADDIVPPL